MQFTRYTEPAHESDREAIAGVAEILEWEAADARLRGTTPALETWLREHAAELRRMLPA